MNSNLANLSLNLLGRAPVPGLVKTRLIPALGVEGAALAHAVLLTHVAKEALTWCSTPETNRLFRLWSTPDCSSPLLQGLALPDQLREQPSGGLGARLDWIVQAGLAEAKGVFLLGGDAVSLDIKTLDWAESVLKDHDAVLIPAEDGGYVLLGVRCCAPELFGAIPWGTAQVAAATRTVLQTLGWSWQEVSGHWDVDSPADWERFNQQKKSWLNNC